MSGTTTNYVYGQDGLLYGEYTSAGALVREYIYLNGNPLAQVNVGSPETATWLHTDQLGTPRFGTNAAGTQVWAWNSDAFGNGTPTGSVTVNLRLPGQYFDSESGLFNNWNRYYNPALGRYITSDPIGLAGGSNTFNYAQQSPLKYTDLTGKAPAVFPLAELVLWGTSWLTLEICNTIPDCRQYYADKIDNAIKATKDGANAAIQWCQKQVGQIFNSAPAANDNLSDREKAKQERSIPLPPNSQEICPLVREQILSCVYFCRSGEVAIVKETLEEQCAPRILR